ncbi:metallophosphoesterase [Catenovulum sediminis]|uniref:Metallophosphoesterase n=1 Tax=Catenovulum sediminis TaxID=1740262 RepID=A0ABV1RL77_9ALTE|nr:metallophosphoesterase [Catenovulum sediminis]
MTARIIQITDCHLRVDKSETFYGANPYRQLQQILKEVSQRQNEVSAVIFTGDLVQDECWPAYQNFVDLLSKHHWQIPLFLIAGNHDDLNHLNKVKTLAGFQQQSYFDITNWRVLLFCSHAENAGGSGSISEAQLSKMLTELDNKSSQHLLVALHHHIVKYGSFIDKYPLKNSDGFMHWIKHNQQVKGIIHGHVHDNRQGDFYGKPWFACPASSVQFCHTAEKAPTVVAGYNELTLHPDGHIDAKNHWLRLI